MDVNSTMMVKDALYPNRRSEMNTGMALSNGYLPAYMLENLKSFQAISITVIAYELKTFCRRFLR